MLKIRRSHNRLIFNMGISCLQRRPLNWGGVVDAVSHGVQAAVLHERLDQLGNIITYSSTPLTALTSEYFVTAKVGNVNDFGS